MKRWGIESEIVFGGERERERILTKHKRMISLMREVEWRTNRKSFPSRGN